MSPLNPHRHPDDEPPALRTPESGANGSTPSAARPSVGLHTLDEGAALGSAPAIPVDDRPLPGPPVRSAKELEPLWNAILDVISRQVQREQFETWFPATALRAADERRVTIAVVNGFKAEWLQKYYRAVIERAVAEVLGPNHDIQFVVDPELHLQTRLLQENSAANSAANGSGGQGSTSGSSHSRNPEGGVLLSMQGRTARQPAPRLGLMSASDFGLNSNYRFENFVVGPCNRFAHAAAFGVSESPGKTYNPFFLHGNVGLGKTHLMQSLCHALLERDPNIAILYLSCETFVNHFISALENGDLQKFRNKYRNVDVLVVDDIHLLANKERTQEEFFHTFNTLYNAGKQIVLSSDSPPKDIPSLQGRLVSRFKWGLVTELEPPCYETRMAILKRKSRERGAELPDDVARLLAERIDNNVRELEGAVTKVLGFAGLAKLPVTVELARECLRDVFTQRHGTPTVEDVLRIVTEHFGVRLSDIQSRKRTAQIAHARQVGMYLTRQVTRLSLEEIGGFFGGRDHTTVLYAIQKVSAAAKSEADAQDVVGELLARLRGRS